MNQLEKDEWVAALRSGDYIQGKSMLISPEGKFCCLGVKCNLDAKAGRYGLRKMGTLGDPYYRHKDLAMSGTWILEYTEQVGLSNWQVDILIEMNDGDTDDIPESKSFAEIADWIEANIPVNS